MKRSVIFVLFMLLVTLGKAQDRESEEETNLRFGVRLGMTISNYVSESTDFFESDRKGFTGAFLMSIPLKDKFTFTPEIAFTQKGTDRSFSTVVGTTMGGSQKIVLRDLVTLSYLEVPLNIAYRFKSEVKVYTGINTAVLLSAQSDLCYTQGHPNGHPLLPSEGKVDVIKKFKKIDMGLNIGLKYDFTEHISADARYTYGLLDISSMENTISNRTINLGVAYTF